MKSVDQKNVRRSLSVVYIYRMMVIRRLIIGIEDKDGLPLLSYVTESRGSGARRFVRRRFLRNCGLIRIPKDIFKVIIL